MARGEIEWKRRDEDGEKVQVRAVKSGDGWIFYHRSRRFDRWEVLDTPSEDDWLALLDGVRRRAARRLIRPEEESRLIGVIRRRFPGLDLK
ncbi:MAG: hypothetical protein K9N52_11275 [Verrucomicrobia bacterium]|nr:hypothetical protein [Verrucomicrobiota bacterium]